jgi:acetylornithine deacetylase/succinyl-diaminopimelate desuccinylase-like protein
MYRARDAVAALFILGAGVSSRAQATSPYGDEAVQVLGDYLRIDTTNPPGRELKGAVFLKSLLEAEGIPVVIDEFAPGRANLLATLKGAGAKPPIVLVSHIDVVPAEPSRWTAGPFSGELRNGLIYGRGAQDMKDEAVVQLMSLIRLKREKIALDRDVLFMATADEEAGFGGALRAVSPEGFLPRLQGAEYLVTEGGEGLLGEDGKPSYFAVETGEKGAFWLGVKATGTPGHAAEPIVDSAPNRLIRALERIRLHKTEMKVLPTVERFLKDQAARVGGERASWYRDIRAALARPDVAETLYEDQAVSPLLRNTISITVVRTGYKTNVIPGTAEAELDVRLLPGEDPQAFLREIRGVIDDPQVVVTPLGTFLEPNASPSETDLFRAITTVLSRRYPGTPVTTSLLTGATESVIYRRLGIVCYGFSPILATREEIDTEHADDERIRVSSLKAATDVFYEVILDLCRH